MFFVSEFDQFLCFSLFFFLQGASASDDEIVLLQAVSKIVSEFIQYKDQWFFIEYMLFFTKCHTFFKIYFSLQGA